MLRRRFSQWSTTKFPTSRTNKFEQPAIYVHIQRDNVVLRHGFIGGGRLDAQRSRLPTALAVGVTILLPIVSFLA